MGLSFKRVLPSSSAYKETQPKTCGHWPAPHVVRVRGEKVQKCADCYRNDNE